MCLVALWAVLTVGDGFSTAAAAHMRCHAHTLVQDLMDKSASVVTKRDGKPLSDKDGPFQLVVPGEKRGARWVRQVTALKIRASELGGGTVISESSPRWT